MSNIFFCRIYVHHFILFDTIFVCVRCYEINEKTTVEF